MLIRIWDFLFTRKVWTVIARTEVYSATDNSLPIALTYTLQDQFGNIKQKNISY